MKDTGRLLWLALGVVIGAVGFGFWMAGSKPVEAGNDRHEDYVLCTGPVAALQHVPTDGVWLLDYRSGKLLGTVINRTIGKIIGWAEVDLVAEFSIPPRQNVHFLMTTGQVANGQAALYVAETQSGRFGVYTMGPRRDGGQGIAIIRHDLTVFRQPKN
ncbi:MAG TPA: hypothetical protein VKE94_16885 [Gemmataceae bacterium]|nr:hypothetical protein [Gemmataceae bacterium]